MCVSRWQSLILVFLALQCSVHSFLPSHSPRHCKPSTNGSPTRGVRLLDQKDNDNNNDGQSSGGGGNPLGFLFNPYESKIPKEIEQEIYEAEGNTAAAKDRTQRIALYVVVAVVGLGAAFFNGFLSELRGSETPDGLPFDIMDSPFAWANSNFLFQLLFLNKIGGFLFLLTGAGAGLLAEAELDTRRINAEKIYEELVRRREKKERGTEKTSQSAARKKKRRKGSKESKRLGALAEVMDRPTDENEPGQPQIEKSEEKPVPDETSSPSKEETGGIFDSIKGFYDKADNMAASQALLLNKKLEDAGVLDKVTDESGMRVIGKEEAAKLQRDESKDASEKPKSKK